MTEAKYSKAEISQTTSSQTTFRYTTDEAGPGHILCAAIHFKTENAYAHQPRNIEHGIVLCGWRHHNCIAIASAMHIPKSTKYVQGFLTSKGMFVDREEGAAMAIAAGQVEEGAQISKCLTSEDLY